jgi:hypothetical protein
VKQRAGRTNTNAKFHDDLKQKSFSREIAERRTAGMQRQEYRLIQQPGVVTRVEIQPRLAEGIK